MGSQRRSRTISKDLPLGDRRLMPQQAGYQSQVLTTELLHHYPLPEHPWILQIFIRGNPFRGSAGLSEQSQQVLQRSLQSSWLRGLILYGSPYVMAWFQTSIAQFCPALPWVFSYGQMPQAQAVACGRLLGLGTAVPQDGVFTD